MSNSAVPFPLFFLFVSISLSNNYRFSSFLGLIFSSLYVPISFSSSYNYPSITSHLLFLSPSLSLSYCFFTFLLLFLSLSLYLFPLISLASFIFPLFVFPSLSIYLSIFTIFYRLSPLDSHEGPAWQVDWAHPKFGSILASCSYDRKVKSTALKSYTYLWKEKNFPRFGKCIGK